MSKVTDWVKTSDRLPEENMIVDTKIHDSRGERNHQTMVFHSNLWWVSRTVHTYYTPTHWRYIPKHEIRVEALKGRM